MTERKPRLVDTLAASLQGKTLQQRERIIERFKEDNLMWGGIVLEEIVAMA